LGELSRTPVLLLRWCEQVLQKPHFKEQKRIRSELMNFEPAKNVPNSSWLVRQICSELFGLGCGRDRTRTLRLYLYCMGWKLWKLIQISFGYWDDDVSLQRIVDNVLSGSMLKCVLCGANVNARPSALSTSSSWLPSLTTTFLTMNRTT